MIEPRSFTPEEEADIRRSYKEARYPGKQVGILAQLYACEPAQIRSLLGLDEPSKGRPGRAREVRVAAVAAVLEEGMSQHDAARLYGLPIATVHGWVKEARGIAPQPRHWVSDADRSAAVAAVLEDGETLQEVADRFGVTARTVTGWVRKARQEGQPLPPEALPEAPRSCPAAGALESRMSDTLTDLLCAEGRLQGAGLLSGQEKAVLQCIVARVDGYTAGIRCVLQLLREDKDHV